MIKFSSHANTPFMIVSSFIPADQLISPVYRHYNNYDKHVGHIYQPIEIGQPGGFASADGLEQNQGQVLCWI